MRTQSYSAQAIRTLLRQQTIATLPEIMTALGTTSPCTARRKLATIGGRSSYSHRGCYYTLDELADYDEHGLWCYEDIHFSSTGTLLQTAEDIIGRSATGYFTDEFSRLVHLDTRNSLPRLVEAGRLTREPIDGHYLYCSNKATKRKQQLLARKVAGRQLTIAGLPDTPDLKTVTATFVSTLDEHQRRLYAGLESVRQGYGGDLLVSEFLKMNPQTVARGRKELQSGELDIDRIRKPGGGRPPIEKKARNRCCPG